ncbi:MAG TPA: hypothetical protein VFH23_17120 [Jiangellaceae bacterium]|nr:hypothetical protein [Jiangellaceae bacterium]
MNEIDDDRLKDALEAACAAAAASDFQSVVTVVGQLRSAGQLATRIRSERFKQRLSTTSSSSKRTVVAMAVWTDDGDGRDDLSGSALRDEVRRG